MRHLFITFHPRFTIAHPMWVIMDRRLHTGVTITGYTIIVIAAVAIDPTMHAAVWSISPAPAASPADMNSRSSADPTTGKTARNILALAARS